MLSSWASATLNIYKTTLEKHQGITFNLTGGKYVGISLKWDYDKRMLHTSVPDFVKNRLHKFQHSIPPKPQHTPAYVGPIIYGSKVQQPTPEYTSSPLSKEEIKRMQEII
jgi:hypothetical protein